MNARPYQSAAIDNTLAALASSPILVAPTGSGKTFMGTEIVGRHGGRILWLAHRKELIIQAAERLMRFGLNVGIIMPGFVPMPMAQVQVASIQTLIRRDRPDAGLIVIDEAHHAAASTYRDILDSYSGVPVLGLTATPFRMDGKGLGDLFGSIVVAAYTEELCEAGWLERPKVWASQEPDLQGIKITAGDYNLKQLGDAVHSETLYADIVATWMKRARGLRTVVFAVDVEHSLAITDAFRDAGARAEHLDGATPGRERDRILAALAAGSVDIVSNCNVLTEGWDLPALECAVIARPTASLGLHLQMIGRVMRAADGKGGAIVLDHAGNHHKHGLVTRRLKYSLTGGGEPCEPLGLRRCRACGLFFEVKRFACPECGWMPTAEEVAHVRPVVHGDGELVEFDDADFAYRAKAWAGIEEQREGGGYKSTWSLYRFEERFGTWPVVLDGQLIDPTAATMEQKSGVYRELLATAGEHGFKPGWASHRYRDFFGVWPHGFVGDVRGEQIRHAIRDRFAAVTK